MSIEFDYTEMIEELLEDLNEGILQSDETVQVLRYEEALPDGYLPILDIYYDDEIMTELFNVEEGDEDYETILEEKELYLQDKPHLETCQVSDILEEMQGKMKK